MNPPPIVDALRKGWESFEERPVPILVAFLLASLLSMVLIGIPGLFWISLKALRGETPQPEDAWIGLKKPVDHLVMILLQAAGLLLCFIGVFVTQGLFFSGSLLIIDKDMDWNSAKDRCLKQIRPNLLPWVLFAFLATLAGSLGSVLCGIGALVTMPIGMIALAYAYEETLGKAKA